MGVIPYSHLRSVGPLTETVTKERGLCRFGETEATLKRRHALGERVSGPVLENRSSETFLLWILVVTTGGLSPPVE